MADLLLSMRLLDFPSELLQPSVPKVNPSRIRLLRYEISVWPNRVYVHSCKLTWECFATQRVNFTSISYGSVSTLLLTSVSYYPYKHMMVLHWALVLYKTGKCPSTDQQKFYQGPSSCSYCVIHSCESLWRWLLYESLFFLTHGCSF